MVWFQNTFSLSFQNARNMKKIRSAAIQLQSAITSTRPRSREGIGFKAPSPRPRCTRSHAQGHVYRLKRIAEAIARPAVRPPAVASCGEAFAEVVFELVPFFAVEGVFELVLETALVPVELEAPAWTVPAPVESVVPTERSCKTIWRVRDLVLHVAIMQPANRCIVTYHPWWTCYQPS